jgi:thiol-disulfide isomerase/thioredoxin
MTGPVSFLVVSCANVLHPARCAFAAAMKVNDTNRRRHVKWSIPREIVRAEKRWLRRQEVDGGKAERVGLSRESFPRVIALSNQFLVCSRIMKPMKKSQIPIQILAFFLALSALPATLLCQKMEWEEAPQYEVGINGAAQYATRVFQPMNNKPYLLVIPEKSKTILFIELGAKKISEIVATDVQSMTEFIIATKGLPAGKPVAQYAIKGGVTTFGYAGKTYTIRVRESLVGDVTEGMLLAHSPVYKIIRDAYKPKKAHVDVLKAYMQKTELVVLFATWCPTCKRVIPHLLRLLKDAANPHFAVRFIGIAMGGQEPRAELEKFGYEYPDIIVFQGGKERGRITGEPNKSLEETLVALLKK